MKYQFCGIKGEEGDGRRVYVTLAQVSGSSPGRTEIKLKLVHEDGSAVTAGNICSIRENKEGKLVLHRYSSVNGHICQVSAGDPLLYIKLDDAGY